MRGGKPHQIQPVTLNLLHQLRLFPPKRGDIPHPQSQPLQPRSGSLRPITTTATHVAAHPTPAVSPADCGSTGWGREKCHVALLGCAWPGPVADLQGARSRALRPGLAPDMGPGLPPGRVSCLTTPFFMGYFEPYLVWPLA